MNSYINLHTHTIYSLLDGQAQPKLLAKRAAESGMSALSINDHGNLHGLLDFYDACIEYGIKPILGEEFYQARKTRFDRDEEERAGRANDELIQRGPYHLTVLARNLTGYKNLIKLSSKSYLDGFYVKPRIDFDLLSDHAEGLIVLSGCLNGIVQQALLRDDFDYARASAAKLQEIVGRENFYIEIQDHGISEQAQVKNALLRIAHDLKALIVPTCDSHYVYKEDALAHDVGLCISTKSLLADEKRFKFANDQFYLKSYEEMAVLFPEEWLKNTLIVGEQVDLNLEFGDLYFPEFIVPTNESIDEHLERLTWEGARQKYNDSIPTERIEYELRVIKNMEFQSYFLVVADVVNWAESNGILVGAGRGSVAGSCVAYCMGITKIDPIRFDLLFERFLIDGRKSPPDADIDMDDRYRDKVLEYIKNKYGYDRVANIATFYSIGAKAAIRDSGKVLGYDFKTTNAINKLVPPPVHGFARSLTEAMRSDKMLAEYNSNPDTKQILDAAKGIEGILRQPGMHAGGIVIAPSDVTDYIPVMRKPNKDGSSGPIITHLKV